MTENKKQLSITDILENPIEEIDIPEIGIVKVKCPTIKDRLDAAREAKRYCEGLSPSELALETTKFLCLKMIVSPSITINDYLNSNDTKMGIILDMIDMWYVLKIKNLNDKRKDSIKSFLDQMKEFSP